MSSVFNIYKKKTEFRSPTAFRTSVIKTKNPTSRVEARNVNTV